MYSNTSGYVHMGLRLFALNGAFCGWPGRHMGLRLDWGKGITGQ